ncbi:MAG: response regulator [Syntrophaceae bacterium]|nr:response regulator [Syntrophaceae bacterium]
MKPRILIVDDDEAIRKVIAEILKDEDLVIDVSESLSGALGLLKSHPYDVILIDKNMPGTDGAGEGGMELLRCVRAKRIPSEVIMMTGYATLDTAIEALRLGAFDYLLKPFSLKDLKAKINRLLEYRSFLDPGKTMDTYKAIRGKIFNLINEKSNMSDSEVDQALTALNEPIDELFHFVKECERFMLSHRESLAHIAGYAEQLKSRIPSEDESQNLLEEIYRHSTNRL